MPWVQTGNIRGPQGPPGTGVAHVVKRKAVDESLLNSITLQNDDELFFDIGASEAWEFDLLLWVTGGTAGDLKLALTWPTGATARWAAQGLATNATANAAPLWTTSVTTSGGTAAVGLLGTGTYVPVVVRGVIVASTTAGRVQLQWGQNALDATNATNVRALSTLRAHRI